MGKKDNIAKAFLADNHRFADLCNYYLFNGKQIIKPDELSEQDTTELIDAVSSIEKAFGIDDKSLSVQKWRDILKRAIIKFTDKCVYVIIGIENQSEIHYAMPIKDMLYDAVNYSRQAAEADRHHRSNKEYNGRAEFLSGFKKTDTLIPVITLTVYWGDDEWDAPRSLHDMFSPDTESLRRYVPDYKLNLIVPHEITDFDKFKTSLGMVLEVIKYASKEYMSHVISLFFIYLIVYFFTEHLVSILSDKTSRSAARNPQPRHIFPLQCGCLTIQSHDYFCLP